MKTSRLAALAGAVALALTLTACGSSEESADDAAGSGASTDAFPVSIEHKFGTAVIPSAPKRIVTVGLTDQDAVLGLGTVPVAVTEWFGKADGRIFAWADDEFAAATNPLGAGQRPEILKDEKQFEKIAALKPDLITAVYSGMTQKDYDLLSKIAPVVAGPKGDIAYTTTWQNQTELIGTAMGKKAEAEQMIADVEAKIAEAKDDHPELAGKTAVTAAAYEGIFLYKDTDPRGRLLGDLGFVFPDSLRTYTDEGDFGVSISAENADEVDIDFVLWVNGRKATTDMVPTYPNLTVAREGRDLFIGDDDTDPVYVASSFVTVLSLPFYLDEIVPRIASAVDGDPSTSSD
ncbi:MAG: iron-siderophore ABC transporter substrate-binding protein [Propionibacteriales bacterium]|nr:iron-siderophore ABC transporter substrate-binding protein [Propionibacteriales bacterium]